jgi:hypothetical protein
VLVTNGQFFAAAALKDFIRMGPFYLFITASLNISRADELLSFSTTMIAVCLYNFRLRLVSHYSQGKAGIISHAAYNGWKIDSRSKMPAGRRVLRLRSGLVG